MTKNLILATAAAIFILSACSPAAMEKPTEAMMDKPTEAMTEMPTEVMMDKPAETMTEMPTEAMMDKPTEVMMETPDGMMTETPTDAMGDINLETPAWFKASLTNVQTGKSFMISDYKGKVVLVENLAMWCPNCKQQQQQVKKLNEQLGMHSDLIAIGLDVDANEVAADLKTYSQNNGFDWIYAVAPQEVLHEFSSLYGDQFLNPPSTPILIIDRKGEVHPMPFGIKSSDDLKKFIDPFLSAAM